MKKILGVVSVVLLVGIIIFYMSLGSIVKTIAEKVGSETLGVDVHIGSIDIAALDKRITVRDVRISNPEGFKGPYAMKVDYINIEAETLSGDLLKFNDVTFKGTDLFLEINEKGTNFNSLKNNSKENSRKSFSKRTSMGDGKEPPKIIVKKFEISEAMLHPKIILVKSNLKAIKLPKIVLKNIGQKSDGIRAGKVVAEIWAAISSKAIKASTSTSLLDGISHKEALDKAKSGLKSLFGR